MKTAISIFLTLSFLAITTFAQKGVDTQTQKITEKTGNNDNTNVSRSWNWGKDKTKVREKLANPYKLTSRRDMLIQNIVEVLEEKKLIVDDVSSKPSEGIIITQPFVFAKGTVISRSELNRYAILPDTESVWRSGRYSLRIEVVSIDGIQNNVNVLATIEGKSENGLLSEWTKLPTSGVAEDEFLAKLIETVTGKPIEGQTDN